MSDNITQLPGAKIIHVSASNGELQMLRVETEKGEVLEIDLWSGQRPIVKAVSVGDEYEKATALENPLMADACTRSERHTGPCNGLPRADCPANRPSGSKRGRI